MSKSNKHSSLPLKIVNKTLKCFITLVSKWFTCCNNVFFSLKAEKNYLHNSGSDPVKLLGKKYEKGATTASITIVHSIKQNVTLSITTLYAECGYAKYS